MCSSSSSIIFRHKPGRTNIEQILQGHWSNRRDFTQDVSTSHPNASVCLHSGLVALVYKFLAWSCYSAHIHDIFVPGVVLLKDFTGFEETGVSLPQPCFLTLLRDHGWIGHYSHKEKGKGFHRQILPVSTPKRDGWCFLGVSVMCAKLRSRNRQK